MQALVDYLVVRYVEGDLIVAHPDSSMWYSVVAADVNVKQECGISQCPPYFIPTIHINIHVYIRSKNIYV